MGLKFKVAELRQELMVCELIAREYIDRASREKFTGAANKLTYIFKNSGQSRDWMIDEEDSLKIEFNSGKHEISGRGKNLQGRLSFIWQLRKLDCQTVELVGKASTAISIHEIVDSIAKDDYIFKWHVDVVTDENAPGPAFHTQIDNPKNLPVPRFPSILFSPVDCLDFLLGELFQKDWPIHQFSHSQTQRFAAAQKRRLYRLLCEQKEELDEISKYSAWITLNKWKPSDDVFIRK